MVYICTRGSFGSFKNAAWQEAHMNVLYSHGGFWKELPRHLFFSISLRKASYDRDEMRISHTSRANVKQHGVARIKSKFVLLLRQMTDVAS